MELTRAAIHAVATHMSKLIPEVNGSAYPTIGKILAYRPNPYMTCSQFLYRLSTILDVNNTAFIVPIEDASGYIVGYYPILPQMAEVVESGGLPYLRYTFAAGQKAAVEMSKVGVLTQFQYNNDFFGESNRALQPTMELIHTQNQGIIEGVKNSAAIRFIAQLANFTKQKDIDDARKRFVDSNLSNTNTGGLMIYGNEYKDVKQIYSKNVLVDSAQMSQINENVFNYFGVNKAIMQNDFDENKWSAFYEGKIEPRSVMLSLAMTNMTFSSREVSCGNEIMWTANRLQYASNTTKLQVTTQLFDRGLITRNQIMDIWNMSHVEGGDEYYIRGEYLNIKKVKDTSTNKPVVITPVENTPKEGETIATENQ